MCGILAVVGNIQEPRDYYLNKSKLIRHRGPDWNGIYYSPKEEVVICHERLSIVGVDNGSQPIISECGNYILSVNGEIYNYKNLLQNVLHDRYRCVTKSDCEVIIYLYKEFGMNFIKMLDGIFAFVLYDKLNHKIITARDPFGVLPLYSSKISGGGCFWVSSELKCFNDEDSDIYIHKPGTYSEYIYRTTTAGTRWDLLTSDTFYFEPLWKNMVFDSSTDEESVCANIKNKLTESVRKRMMSDVPFGVLLSGGLDSSLVASISSRILKNNPSSFGNKLHTFSIGLKNSPDILAARKVAEFLKTEHHELSFTIQDGIDCLRNLIYHLETFDVTTIRASTPMFLMARKIKSHGIKMVLSGEGADEIFGGYLYFHKAPNENEFHRECVKRVLNLHSFDCLRANKSTMAWGLEARVPFLDQKFVNYCININPKLKCNKIEKYILRKAFDCQEEAYLPHDILWRQKEQFTDGVGYSWLDELIVYCEKSITDEQFSMCKEQYSVKNKEEAFYRIIFEELFPNKHSIIERWVPKTEWEGVSYDPSGRAQQIHKSNL